MPRYFFNVYDGKDIFDKVGVVLADTKHARRHTISVALSHIEEIENQGQPWQMEALDEAGRIVGTMDFGVEKGDG